MQQLSTITSKEFLDIQSFILNSVGINLEGKKSLIYNRLRHIVQSSGFQSFGAYFSHVLRDSTGHAIQRLTDKLTTNHTFFYREASHFTYLRKHVLPELIEQKYISASRPLRIWCAGCSTGEEPYTLAMELTDYFGEKNPINYSILATDISSTVLDEANKGIYKLSRLKGIPRDIRASYFTRLNHEQVQVKECIRNKVKFKLNNLKQDAGDKLDEFHIIFCRNVMIYFQIKLKMRLINQFYTQTKPGGYFFVSHSESYNYPENPYTYAEPSIYKKELEK